MPQLLGAVSCCFGGQRSFRIGRLTRPACRLDETFERRRVDAAGARPYGARDEREGSGRRRGPKWQSGALAVAASHGFHARAFERKYLSGAARFALRPFRQLFCARLQERYGRATASLDSRNAPREGQGPPPQYENAAGRSCRCLRLRRPMPSHQEISSRDRRDAGGVAARANHRWPAVRYGMTGSGALGDASAVGALQEPGPGRARVRVLEDRRVSIGVRSSTGPRPGSAPMSCCAC